jgi:hypothetical protein
MAAASRHRAVEVFDYDLLASTLQTALLAEPGDGMTGC